MLGGAGYFQGSTVLVSGTAGSGKTSVAAHFALAACQRGERCLYLPFEEAPAQIVRNMRSIGLDLAPCVESGLLRFHASRSSLHGLELHLAVIHRLVHELAPQVVILDPVGNLAQAGTWHDATLMVTRLIDFLKSQGITALLTSLTSGGEALEETKMGISSLVDTWLLLRDVELGAERNRTMYVLKSRGMAHSNQLREFLITDRGIAVMDAHLGPDGVLTGSVRQAHEAREKAARLARQQEVEGRRRELDRKRDALEARIAALRKAFEVEEAELTRILQQEQAREEVRGEYGQRMADSRHADALAPSDGGARPRPGRRP